jgi:hypothetical protein
MISLISIARGNYIHPLPLKLLVILIASDMYVDIFAPAISIFILGKRRASKANVLNLLGKKPFIKESSRKISQAHLLTSLKEFPEKRKNVFVDFDNCKLRKSLFKFVELFYRQLNTHHIPPHRERSGKHEKRIYDPPGYTTTSLLKRNTFFAKTNSRSSELRVADKPLLYINNFP